VIKVEHPNGGDPTRHWGTRVAGGERTYYLSANRNKRSIAIDFSHPEGVALVKTLARECDVLVENYLTGALARYGLDYESLRVENPGLIYCSISGYGRSGLWADRPGYDSVIQAESGLMSVTGPVDGEPCKVGVPVSDITAGMYATQGILAALFRRARTGRGTAVDIALFDCTLANHVSVAANALLLNQVPGRFGNGHADILPQGMYYAQDGAIMFHVGSDAQFRRFAIDVLGDKAMAEDPRFATNDGRRLHRALMEERISAALRTRKRAEWIPRFAAAGVPAGLVQNVLEALTSEAAQSRGMVVEIDHPTAGKISMVNSPLKMSEGGVVPPSPAPTLGEHTDWVLRHRLMLDDAAISRLRREGVVA
jgi:crotonobetainyl-CoA:carnitine CoA-transferase CaiB-like acyl-CoA transferase